MEFDDFHAFKETRDTQFLDCVVKCPINLCNTRKNRKALEVPLKIGADPDVGKSRTCPILDLTIKSLPKYLLIVLALAGDSTITSDLPIVAYF